MFGLEQRKELNGRLVCFPADRRRPEGGESREQVYLMSDRTVDGYLLKVKETRLGDGRWALRDADEGGKQGRETLKVRTCNLRAFLLQVWLDDCSLRDDFRAWARAR